MKATPLQLITWWMRPDLDPRIYEEARRWVDAHPIDPSLTSLEQLSKDRRQMDRP